MKTPLLLATRVLLLLKRRTSLGENSPYLPSGRSAGSGCGNDRPDLIEMTSIVSTPLSPRQPRRAPLPETPLRFTCEIS